MLYSTVLSSMVLFLGLAVAHPTEQGLAERQEGNGDRVCALGGISCRYNDNTRCAKLCMTGRICSCPEGHWDNGHYYGTFYGADCIPAWTALGRHMC